MDVVELRKAWKSGGVKRLSIGSEEYEEQINPIAKPFFAILTLVLYGLGVSGFVLDTHDKFIVGPVAILFGTFLLLRVVLRPKQTITVTADGITLQRGKKTKSIPWNEVLHSYTRIPHKSTQRIHYVYTLDDDFAFDDTSYPGFERLAALMQTAINTPATY